MISAPPQIPNYAQGFACQRGESACRELWDGLVGLWAPFLGPTGGTLLEWSGRRNDGTLENMTAAADWVLGEKGWALRFTADKAGVTASPAKVDQAAGTVVLTYCRRGTANSFSALFNVETAANNSPHEMLCYGYYSAGPLGFFPNWDQSPSRYWSFGFDLNDLTLGKWHTIAATWGNQQIRGYLDGLLCGSEVGSGSWVSSAWSNELLYLGKAKGSLSLQCAGDISVFYLFDRPLPARSIARLHDEIYAPLRLSRRVCSARPTIGGPYQVMTLETFHTGPAAAELFHAGVAEGEIFSTGSILGECDGGSG
jgi:hypothetical protein